MCTEILNKGFLSAMALMTRQVQLFGQLHLKQENLSWCLRVSKFHSGIRGCLAFFVSVLNDRLKVLCDVVHVISINIDIDIVTLASSLASQFFLRLCPNIRHWSQPGLSMHLIPTEGLLFRKAMLMMIVVHKWGNSNKGCGTLHGLCSESDAANI